MLRCHAADDIFFSLLLQELSFGYFEALMPP